MGEPQVYAYSLILRACLNATLLYSPIYMMQFLLAHECLLDSNYNYKCRIYSETRLCYLCTAPRGHDNF